MKKIIMLIVLAAAVVSVPHIAFTINYEYADIYVSPETNPDFFSGYVGGDGNMANPYEWIDWSIGNSRPYSLSRTNDMVFSTNIGNYTTAADWKERMRITKDGKVGIGKTAPTVNLHVGGDTVADSKLLVDAGGDNFAGLQLKGNRTWLLQSTNSLKNSVFRIYDESGGGERLRINTSGYVGIGIGETDPMGRLHVEGDGDIIFNTSGNVGIGNTSPTADLHVGGDSVADTKLLVDAGGDNFAGLQLKGNRTWQLQSTNSLKNSVFRIYDESGGGERLRINTSGYIGIGIGETDPIYPLEMGSGAHVTTGGVWTDASSKEYKENINDLSIDRAMETLKGLHPVEFNYKIDKDEKYVGFIAEDVPEAVATNNRKGLSPMDIAAVLTKVVQDQQQTITNLSEKIEKLEKEVKLKGSFVSVED